MTTGEIAQISQVLKSKTSEVDQILLTASRLASTMTNYTGIAAKPKCAAVTVTRFETAFIDEYSFVLIMISSTGSVVSKHIRLSAPMAQASVSRLAAALNENVAGLSANEINLPVMLRLEAMMGADAALITPIVKAIYETMTEFDNGELRLSGINHLLQYPDYSDPEELKDLLGTLEHKEEILDLVSKDKTDDISVVIGIARQRYEQFIACLQADKTRRQDSGGYRCSGTASHGLRKSARNDRAPMRNDRRDDRRRRQRTAAGTSRERCEKAGRQ